MADKTQKKVSKTEESHLVSEDGEILKSLKTSTYAVESEPAYIKLYIQDIGILNKITGKSNEVLLEFIRHMGYNNVIPTYKPIKQMIAKKLNISLHTVDKAVKMLKKNGLFIPFARGMYIADPNLFAKGKWSDIKNLRLVIQYDSDGTKRLKSNLPEEVQTRLNL
jgi:hypothetical protein